MGKRDSEITNAAEHQPQHPITSKVTMLSPDITRGVGLVVHFRAKHNSDTTTTNASTVTPFATTATTANGEQTSDVPPPLAHVNTSIITATTPVTMTKTKPIPTTDENTTEPSLTAANTH
nr:unnamed protein product [Spirometra erinaceieuropaei]